jgi:DNA-directed RNA polymerase subunit RPC12/RpoP
MSFAEANEETSSAAVTKPSTSSGITLANLEKEAEDFMFGDEKFLGYLSRGVGKYILFKKDAESLMKYAYKCPNCGKEGGGEIDMEKPYTITCEGCETIVFKQEKVKGKRKKRKKKE